MNKIKEYWARYKTTIVVAVLVTVITVVFIVQHLQIKSLRKKNSDYELDRKGFYDRQKQSESKIERLKGEFEAYQRTDEELEQEIINIIDRELASKLKDFETINNKANEIKKPINTTSFRDSSINSINNALPK